MFFRAFPVYFPETSAGTLVKPGMSFDGVELSHGDWPARQPMAFSCAVGICREFHGVDHGFRHWESLSRSLAPHCYGIWIPLFSSIAAASTSDHHVSL